MIHSYLSRLAWTWALLATQVLVLDRIHPWGYGAPLICPIIVITLPLSTPRTAALLWAFCIGLAADVFSGTPGIGSAAMTLVGLVQPSLLAMMAPRDSEENLRPSFRTIGLRGHFQFIAILLLLHHCTYFALESFSYFHLLDAATSMAVSYVASLALILLVEKVRNPKN